MRTSADHPRARTAVLAAGVLTLGLVLTGCGGPAPSDGAPARAAAPRDDAPRQDPARLPGVGDRLQSRIPRAALQVVAVHGAGKDSADARVELWDRGKAGAKWTKRKTWDGHNGKRGWTTDHREGDRRSPVGVFGLTDAGGVLADPGAKLPYTHSAAFTPPSYWAPRTRHDFDHVIAIDYNRLTGTSPLDPTRPQGREKGGSIWLHVDHGSGTSGCVSIPTGGMRYLLRTLDPAAHPVVVMGDRAELAR